MPQYEDSSWKRPTVIAVGGDVVHRASLCYETSNANLHIEPVAGFEELVPRDFVIADVFLVWDDLALVEQLVAQLARCQSWASVIVFQSQPSIGEVVAAVEAGAADVLEWPCTPEALENAVNGAMRKRRRRMPRWERTRRANERLQCLSRRERQVIDEVARGFANKEIARNLAISHRTVEIHRANALAKLGVEHTADAIRLVLEATMYDDLSLDEGELLGPRAA